MPAPAPIGTFGRVVKIALVLAALSVVTSIRAAEQPVDTEATLARTAQARFDVVLLRDGIALAGKDAPRRVEIARACLVQDLGAQLRGEHRERGGHEPVDRRRALAAAHHEQPQRPLPRGKALPGRRERRDLRGRDALPGRIRFSR